MSFKLLCENLNINDNAIFKFSRTELHVSYGLLMMAWRQQQQIDTSLYRIAYEMGHHLVLNTLLSLNNTILTKYIA